MSNQSNILTITESPLRRWICTGILPVRKVGNRNLVYYPTLVAYLSGNDTTSAHSHADACPQYPSPCERR